MKSPAPSNTERDYSNSTFEVFFDGDCPLCRREINFLSRRDKKHAIRFTDIATADFDPAAYGHTREHFMARIRGRTADGLEVEGLEVFRALYSAVGFRWLVGLSRLPLISHILEGAYLIFAKNRLRLTGRCAADACAVPRTRLTQTGAP